MGTQSMTLATDTKLQKVIDLPLDGLTSEHSRRAYQKALADFMAWYTGQDKPGLTKASDGSVIGFGLGAYEEERDEKG